MPLNRSTFWKLVTIGRDKRLADITAKLPSNFSTIYEVSQLNDAQLEQALGANIIHPAVRRADIAALRKPGDESDATSQGGKNASPPMLTEIIAGCQYELKIPKGVAADHCARISQALGKVHAEFGVEITRIERPPSVPAGRQISASPSGASSPVNRKPILHAPRPRNKP